MVPVPVITLKKDKLLTTSLEVARVFEKAHDNVLRAIKDLEIPNDIHALNFEAVEIIEKNALGGTVVKKHYVMTRDGFFFLAMGFTGKKAAKFKIAFIDAFNKMEKKIQSLNEWAIERHKCIDVRKMETDIIKEFVKYATDQGSESAKFYFKHITDATYKVLGLVRHKEPNFRDTLDLINLNQLQTAELVAARSLKRHMLLGEHYKEIFKLVKKDLEAFVTGLLIDTKLELTN